MHIRLCIYREHWI